MTAQVPDTVTWQGRSYDLVGIDGGPLFEPAEHGIEPQMASTACYRGFVCGYGLRANGLFLNRLDVCVPNPPPPLRGATPRPPVAPWRMWEYVGIGLRLPFAGRLLLGRDFDDAQYRHMGFQDWQAYGEVQEAVLRGRSVVVTEQATDVVPPPREMGDVVDWMDRRFRRSPEARGWP
jgi:hypothetical protein